MEKQPYSTIEPIPLDVAKQIIMASLRDFDEELGNRAAAILHNPDRLNITEEASSLTGMMQCRPAGLTIDDLKSAGMYREDFADRFAPHFNEQENPNNYSIIDYEYTYTKESVSYLAHKLGHAIADDAQRENGLSFRDFTPDQLERQAYLIQSIVADSIDPEFNIESGWGNTGQSAITNEFNRTNQRFDAVLSYESVKALAPEERTAQILGLLGGASALLTKEDVTPPPVLIRFDLVS